ncbi:NAD(P)-dependent oxidoreductase [Hydrogenophaga palleronii]|uniref:NAD(P)-dependent oxidoreductase n=1 Tax=Hydrogenophaga palleronii TaxID=65655 RepID=UPI0008253654|nr:NAD(P)-dependent oxidoreductase [Hydrogenophaga palleronii]
MKSTIRTVAFIGVGNMGARMARRVAEHGFELTVCDSSADAVNSFAAQGARIAERPRDCVDCDAIVLLVGNDEQLLEVALGRDGLRQRMGSGAHAPLVVVMSTVMPATVRAVRDALEPLGARVVDAPVSGGLLGAQEGTLSFILGGRAEEVAALTPLLKAMGRSVFHCGDVGAGQAAKIINNMIGITNLYLVPEACQLAHLHGIPLDKLNAVLEESSGRNFLSRDFSLAREHYAAWADTEEKFDALAQIIGKDLGLALRLAQEAQLNLPLLNGVSGALADVTSEVFDRWQLLIREASRLAAAPDKQRTP